jgi:hypothetical protein
MGLAAPHTSSPKHHTGSSPEPSARDTFEVRLRAETVRIKIAFNPLVLKGRAKQLPAAELEQLVRRWYCMSLLTRRYSRGNPETDIDYDIRQISESGVTTYCEAVIKSELSENFWSNLGPLQLDTSSVNSAFFLAYQAAQVKAGDKGFLSRDIR